MRVRAVAPSLRDSDYYKNMEVRMPSSIFSTLLLATLALAAATARGGQNAWTLHGPVGGAGAVYSIAAHPTNGSIALAGTARGIFRTIDVGLHWTLVEDDVANAPVRIVFDPSDPSRVVAMDGRLLLSTDTGQTFAPLSNPGGGAYAGVFNFAPNGTLYAFAPGGRLYRATAPFTNWTEVAQGWGTGNADFITIDPFN